MEKLKIIFRKLLCRLFGHDLTPTHIEFNTDKTVEVTYYCLRCKEKINKIH